MSTHQPPTAHDGTDHPDHLLPRLGGAALLLSLFAAAMWFAWLGWDDEYHYVDGTPQGPYRAWQVLGCGVAVATGAALAAVAVRRVWAAPILAAAATLGFAVPWGAHAAATDESGLWVVGLFMLLAGMGVGLTILLLLVTSLLPASRR